MNFPFLGKFPDAAAGEYGKAQIVANGVDNGGAAAAFPLDLQRDMVSQHDMLKDAAGSASVLPHNKALLAELVDGDGASAGEGVRLAADQLQMVADYRLGEDFLTDDSSLRQGDIQFIVKHSVFNGLGVVDEDGYVDIRVLLIEPGY